MWPNPQFPADLVTFTGEFLNQWLRLMGAVEAYFNKNAEA